MGSSSFNRPAGPAHGGRPAGAGAHGAPSAPVPGGAPGTPGVSGAPAIGDPFSAPKTSQRNFPMLVGFALFQTWVTLCFFAPQLFPETVDANRVYEFSLVVSVAALVLGAALHRRLDRWLQSAPVLWALAAAAAVGTAIVPFCAGPAPAVAALTVAASLLTGTANGLLNVAWCCAFVRRGNAIDFAVSVVTSSVIIYVLTNLAYAPAINPYVMLGIAIAVPLVSVGLLCLHRGAPTEESTGMAVPIATRPRRSFLVQLCVGIFVVSLTDEFMRNYYLEGTDLSFYSSQVNLLILVFKVIVSVMVVTAIHRMRYEDFSFLYRASFMLALVAALLLPFAGSAGTVGYAITNCGAFLFKLTVLLVSLEYCAQGMPATLSFCIIRAVWSLDLLLGYGLYEANRGLPDGGVDPTVLTVAFVVLVAIAYLFVFSPEGSGAQRLAMAGTGGEVRGPGMPQGRAGEGLAGLGGRAASPDDARAKVATEACATDAASGAKGAALAVGAEAAADPGTSATAARAAERPIGSGGPTRPSESSGTPAEPPAGKTAASALDAACDRLAARGCLSPREADVLRLLARGRTTTRIQDELHISMNTVNTHVRHVFQKLGVHSRQELLDLVEHETD